MRAMVLTSVGAVSEGSLPLIAMDLPEPQPAAGELLIRVSACGVCHTELDEIEGRTPPSSLPRVLGHQVVGRILEVRSPPLDRARGALSRSRRAESGVRSQSKSQRAGHGSQPAGPRAESTASVRSSAPASPTSDFGLRTPDYSIGDRVGVAWIYSACGHCQYCINNLENLCAEFRATGRDADGGYAEYMTVPAAFAYRIPDIFSDIDAAPLLCAGAIGYRSLALTGLRDGDSLGLTGFGASAHLVLLMARHRFPHSAVSVFTRSAAERAFALELGATWAGDTADRTPEPLAAIIDTTPAWKPVVEAMANLRPGGRLVVNAIRKEERDKEALLALDYPSHLWMEKQIVSVANVTRRDVREFLQLAAEIPIRPEVETYPLADANRALVDIKERRIRGAKVLVIE